MWFKEAWPKTVKTDRLTTTNLNESPKVKNVLVIVDHFTRYTRTKDQKALTAAKILYEGFISIFRILTDQGKAFTSEVVEQLCL